MPRDALSLRDRRALVAVAVQFFANGVMSASFIARAPQIRDRIGVPVEGYGLLITLAASAGIVGSLLAGRIIHRASSRRVLRLGSLAMLACLPVIGVATTPWLCLLGMLTFMFFDTLVDISMNLQGSWISARRHMPVMNRLHALWSLGTLLGGLGAVAANGAALAPLTHLSLVALLMAVVLSSVSPRLLESDEQGHASDTSGPKLSLAAPRKLWVLMVLAGMFAVIMENTAGDWATFRLADDFGASPALASAAFVAYAIGMTSMRLGGDFLQLKLGRLGLYRLSVLVATLGCAAAALLPHAVLSIVAFFFVGLGVATFMPKLYDDAARLPGRRGAGLGAMTAGMRLACLLSPLVVGGLAGTLSVGAAIAIYTLPSAVALVVVSESSERLLGHAQQSSPSGVL